MKSATEIMLHAQAREATEAHLALLKASRELLIRYVELVNCGDWDPETEEEVQAMRSAIKRCTAWTSTLPQPEEN